MVESELERSLAKSLGAVAPMLDIAHIIDHMPTAEEIRHNHDHNRAHRESNASLQSNDSDTFSSSLHRSHSHRHSHRSSHNLHRHHSEHSHHHHHIHISGPFSKTFSFIKGKVPTLSTGSLHLPTLEEVVLWRTSFNSLLNHKYGSDLFKRFSVKEFSNENVDFWYECEVFKKMKEGKKETIKKANEIYKEFVETSSPREVNLDSDTRAATKAALENGCKSDTFSLSQSRIEQLMNKDSYRRFLKDRLYLDLLETLEEQENGGKKDKE